MGSPKVLLPTLMTLFEYLHTFSKTEKCDSKMLENVLIVQKTKVPNSKCLPWSEPKSKAIETGLIILSIMRKKVPDQTE